MIKTAVSQLLPGMVLAADVYDDLGILLIAESTLLTQSHIEFLVRKSVENVMISGAYSSETISEEATVAESAFDRQYRKTVTAFKEVYSEFKMGRVPVYQEIDAIVEPLYDNVLNDENFARKIWQIQTYDEYTFDHSVRVSMIAGLLGKWCGLSEDRVKEAALSGLLHDMGKCNIPDEILNKPGPLTLEEFKVIKTHSVLGYILVKDIPEISYDVLLGVLQHHERIDGTGYPNGLVGSEISELAKIISIADVYCAMTQNRPYKPAIHPFETMSYILEKCHNSLDFSISRTFLANVAHFYIGHRVELNDGNVGEVIMTYKDDPARPLVRVGETYFDLRRHINLEIVRMFDD